MFCQFFPVCVSFLGDHTGICLGYVLLLHSCYKRFPTEVENCKEGPHIIIYSLRSYINRTHV